MAFCSIIKHHDLSPEELKLFIAKSSFLLPINDTIFADNDIVFADQLLPGNIHYDENSIWLNIPTDSIPPLMDVDTILATKVPIEVSVANYIAIKYSKSLSSSVKFNNYLAKVYGMVMNEESVDIEVPGVSDKILVDIAKYIIDIFSPGDKLSHCLYHQMLPLVLSNSNRNTYIRELLLQTFYTESYPLKTLELLRSSINHLFLLEFLTVVPDNLLGNYATIRDKYEALGIYFLCPDFRETFKTFLSYLSSNNEHKQYCAVILNMLLMNAAASRNISELIPYGVPQVLAKFFLPRISQLTIRKHQISDLIELLCESQKHESAQYLSAVYLICVNFIDDIETIDLTFAHYCNTANRLGFQKTTDEIMNNHTHNIVGRVFKHLMNYDTNTKDTVTAKMIDDITSPTATEDKEDTIRIGEVSTMSAAKVSESYTIKTTVTETEIQHTTEEVEAEVGTTTVVSEQKEHETTIIDDKAIEHTIDTTIEDSKKTEAENDVKKIDQVGEIAASEPEIITEKVDEIPAKELEIVTVEDIQNQEEKTDEIIVEEKSTLSDKKNQEKKSLDSIINAESVFSLREIAQLDAEK